MQSKYWVTLIRKAKQTIFGNDSITDVTDNKTFWRTVKSFSRDKVKADIKRKCKRKISKM